MDPIARNGIRVNDANNANPVRAAHQAEGNASFRDVFSENLKFQFSKHAALRLNDRNITLTGDQMERVEGAIDKAGEKGIRDSLVLLDDLALVVNVKSRTVITAMNQGGENIFSNIDGAVIV